MRHSRSVFQAPPKFHQIKLSLRPAAGAISCKTWRFLNPHSQIHWHFHQIDPDRPEKHFHFSHFLMSEFHPAQWTGSWKKGDQNTYHTPFIDINSPACAWVRVFAGSFKCLWKAQVRSFSGSTSGSPILLTCPCPESKVCGIPRLYLKCFGYVPVETMKSATFPRLGTDKGQVGRTVSFWIAWRTQGPGPFHANMHGVLPSWQNTPESTQHHCWQLYWRPPPYFCNTSHTYCKYTINYII